MELGKQEGVLSFKGGRCREKGEGRLGQPRLYRGTAEPSGEVLFSAAP